MNNFTKIAMGVQAVFAGLTIVKAIKMNKAYSKAEVLSFGEYQAKLDNFGLMKSNHAAVAMVAKNKKTGKYEMFVDESFLTLKPHAQRAILAHEQGHVVLGHLENISKLNKYKRAIDSLTGAQDIELEADAYAASVVGKATMISALLSLKLSKLSVNKRELDYRIKALQGE